MSISTFNWNVAEEDIALPISLVFSPDSLEFVLRQRFRFFLNEWFLNLSEGVPYYRDILIKNPNDSVVRSIFRQVILTTQDIDSIRTLKITIDKKERKLTAEFIAVRTDGTLFDTSKLDLPFIITV